MVDGYLGLGLLVLLTIYLIVRIVWEILGFFGLNDSDPTFISVMIAFAIIILVVIACYYIGVFLSPLLTYRG